MKKILVWGTGKFAKKFIENGYNGEIIGFIETNKSADSYMGKPVYGSGQLPPQYDYIIVATSYATEIYNLAKKLGIDCSKMIFLYGVKQQMGCTDKETLKAVLLERNYTNYCGEFKLTEDSFIKDDAKVYTEMNKRPGFAIREEYMWPVIGEKYGQAGTVNNYFWQDLWAARHIYRNMPEEHFDIGSRLDGFIAHVLCFGIPVKMIDVRPFPAKIEGLETVVADATDLAGVKDNSIESLSALCSLEHFGLGRYGDPIDPEACFKCFDNIQRKLARGGRYTYLSP